MPSVNQFITALVAGLAIGAQAGPCRPYVPPNSVIQSKLTTTEHIQSAAGTSAAYTDVLSKSETETEAPHTTAVQVTGSTEAEPKPTTTDEEATTTTGYPVNESTSSAAGSSTTKSATESVYATSGSLTTEAASESTSTAKDTTSSLPSTTEQSTTSVPSTTSSKPKTTLDTTTLAPTTTSDPTTTTSQASTTTSEASTSTCRPKSELTCNKTGFLGNGDSHLIQVFHDTALDKCKEECEKVDKCKAIGITTANQCELYDTAVSSLGFEARSGWFYSVFDACCFGEDGQTGK